MWRGADRRRFERSGVSLPVVLKRLRPLAVYSSVTRDLAIGGLACHLPGTLGRDARLRVSIDLGDGGPAVECFGKVVWSIPRRSGEEVRPVADTGITLQRVSARDRDRLRKRIGALRRTHAAPRRARSHAR